MAEPNPYHVRELARREFEIFLRDRFAHVALYGQRVAFGSLALAQSGGPLRTIRRLEDGSFVDQDAYDASVYIVAVCSDDAAQRFKSPAGGLPGQVVLVLQGGGALGAYQAGVYQALHEAGIEPDWIIGTSIGAINAGLIAGNEPRAPAPQPAGILETGREDPVSAFGPQFDGLRMGDCGTGRRCQWHPGFFEPSPVALPARAYPSGRSTPATNHRAAASRRWANWSISAGPSCPPRLTVGAAMSAAARCAISIAATAR